MHDILNPSKTRFQYIDKCKTAYAKGVNVWDDDTYVACCLSDFKNLWSETVGFFSKNFPKISFSYYIDESNFSLDAGVSKISENHYVVILSIGCFAVFDDWATVMSPLYNSDFDSKEYSEAISEIRFDDDWNRRFSSYEPEGSNKKCRNLFDRLVGKYSLRGDIDSGGMISNFAVCWIILHEISHVFLGHIDFLIKNGAGEVFLELEINASGSLSENSLEVRRCQEMEADFLANLMAIFLFLTSSAEINEKPYFQTSRNKFQFFISSMSYLPLLFWHSEKNLDDDEKQTHPHPMIRQFNLLTCFEFAQQYIISSGSEWGNLFENPDTYSMIEIYNHSIKHIYFCSRYLGSPISNDIVNSNQDRMRIPYFGEIDSFITDREAVKWVLSLWHSRFQINYFSKYETPHSYIKEWSHLTNRLGAGLSQEFKKFNFDAPKIYKNKFIEVRSHSLIEDSLLAQLVHATRRAPFVYTEEALAGLSDLEKVKKVLADTIQISRHLESKSQKSSY